MTDPSLTGRPPYGTVESYARILRNNRPDSLELSALGIVQIIADDQHWGDAYKVERIRAVVAAAELVREERVPAPSGLDYSRPADGDEPQALDVRRVPSRFQHGRDAGVDELPPVELPTVHLALDGDTACEKQVADLPKTDGHSSDHADVTCRECLEAVPY